MKLYFERTGDSAGETETSPRSASTSQVGHNKVSLTESICSVGSADLPTVSDVSDDDESTSDESEAECESNNYDRVVRV